MNSYLAKKETSDLKKRGEQGLAMIRRDSGPTPVARGWLRGTRRSDQNKDIVDVPFRQRDVRSGESNLVNSDVSYVRFEFGCLKRPFLK